MWSARGVQLGGQVRYYAWCVFHTRPIVNSCSCHGKHGDRLVHFRYCTFRCHRHLPLRVGTSERLGELLLTPVARFDTGIATTTIAHQSWIAYMKHPSNALTGSVVAVYIAGEAGGALLQTAVGDKLGRIRFMQMMCVIVTVGTVVQTASINMGMFLAGRVLAGFAVGGLVGTVPIYLSEISAPHQRGLIGGISGCGIYFGTMASNWVGMACGYVSLMDLKGHNTRKLTSWLPWYRLRMAQLSRSHAICRR